MTSATATALSSFAANSSAAIDRVQKELKELGLWKFAGCHYVYHAGGVRHALPLGLLFIRMRSMVSLC
ncbi:MAG: hypothetical protein ACLRYB_10460 [Segatella copri]